jgi:hypothetical protein
MMKHNCPKRLRKRSKNPIPVLKNKVWRVFSKYIRLRDKYTCFTCGKVERPGQAGHRYHGRLDYDPINVNCQCPRCNKWLHGNLGEYERRLVEKYGQDVADELHLRANKSWKPSRQELEELLIYWSEQLKVLENRSITVCDKFEKE